MRQNMTRVDRNFQRNQCDGEQKLYLGIRRFLYIYIPFIHTKKLKAQIMLQILKAENSDTVTYLNHE